ncbi:MAG: hypothetical protein JNM94_06240 [Phycisphaerae bacterium]|nr:hypothetical protein [Phycisphaerae bacterium]
MAVAFSLGAFLDANEGDDPAYGGAWDGARWSDVTVRSRTGCIRIERSRGMRYCGNEPTREELIAMGRYDDLTSLVPPWSATRNPNAAGQRAFDRTEQANGWPFLSLSCVLHDDEIRELRVAKATAGSEADVQILGGKPYQGGITNGILLGTDDPVRVLPLRPIWSGFVADSLIYATAVAAALMVPGVVRRWHRSRRNLCVQCGYAVGALPRCPECGNAE